ncbi:MAG: hypothetical protein ACQESF_05810 [Nanobdellota archaeon]
MLKKAILVLLAIIVFILFAGASGFDHTEDAWHDVEDWEVEICSKWGGREKAQSHTGGMMSTQFQDQAATVQALVKELYAGDKNLYVYEVSWYLQPIKGQQKYKVLLRAENGQTKKVAAGSAPATSGDSGYYAEENTSINYTNVILDYESGKLVAPVVR